MNSFPVEGYFLIWGFSCTKAGLLGIPVKFAFLLLQKCFSLE